MKKKNRIKYTSAFRKIDAKHYVVYATLDRLGVKNPYHVATQILENLSSFPR